MKICLISREYPPDTAWGGIGTYTHQLAHGLAERGARVHVIAQSFDRNREDADGSVTVHRVCYWPVFGATSYFREWGLRMEHSWRVYRRLRQVIARHGIDVVEAPNFSGEGFVYSLRKRTPLVTRLHTNFSGTIQMYGWSRTLDHQFSCAVEDAAVLRSDAITCSTRAHAQSVAQELDIPPDRVEHIPLGVSLPDLEIGGVGLELSHPAVLFVGRLERRKGVHVLLKAIPHILREVPDAHFFLLGRDTFNDGQAVSFEGEACHSFKEAILRQLPQQALDRVHFLGYVAPDVLAQYYRACDVFVAPSLYESFGFIYLEAMSYGKPVIGCSVGGVPEVVEDGVTGSLVPPEDPHRLAQAISRLLKDPALRLEQGLRARNRVESAFTRTHMVERTLQVYDRLLNN